MFPTLRQNQSKFWGPHPVDPGVSHLASEPVGTGMCPTCVSSRWCSLHPQRSFFLQARGSCTPVLSHPEGPIQLSSLCAVLSSPVLYPVTSSHFGLLDSQLCLCTQVSTWVPLSQEESWGDRGYTTLVTTSQEHWDLLPGIGYLSSCCFICFSRFGLLQTRD